MADKFDWTDAERQEWIRQWEVIRTKFMEYFREHPEDEIWLYAYSENTGEKLGGNPYGEWD